MRLRALPFVAVVLVSLPILFAPASDVPTAPPGADKLVHLALFAALAITGSLARIPRTPLAATLAAYALGSEILQAALPLHRSFSLADVAADLSGLAFGLLLCRF